jgi:outer membrane protein OmpA-like peptidoglycan-associated protein
MTRLFIALILACAFCSAPVEAQQPSKADIVKALTVHPRTRSFRGITVEGKERPPSIDLHIPFDYDSDKLTSDALLTLRRLGEALKDPKLAGYRFRLAGYTDARGTAEYNQRLSERRAASVRDYLIYQYDIDASRLESIGFGKTHLADPAHPEAAINRRVQVTNLGPTS